MVTTGNRIISTKRKSSSIQRLLRRYKFDTLGTDHGRPRFIAEYREIILQEWGIFPKQLTRESDDIVAIALNQRMIDVLGSARIRQQTVTEFRQSRYANYLNFKQNRQKAEKVEDIAPETAPSEWGNLMDEASDPEIGKTVIDTPNTKRRKELETKWEGAPAGNGSNAQTLQDEFLRQLFPAGSVKIYPTKGIIEMERDHQELLHAQKLAADVYTSVYATTKSADPLREPRACRDIARAAAQDFLLLIRPIPPAPAVAPESEGVQHG